MQRTASGGTRRFRADVSVSTTVVNAPLAHRKSSLNDRHCVLGETGDAESERRVARHVRRESRSPQPGRRTPKTPRRLNYRSACKRRGQSSFPFPRTHLPSVVVGDVGSGPGSAGGRGGSGSRTCTVHDSGPAADPANPEHVPSCTFLLAPCCSLPLRITGALAHALARCRKVCVEGDPALGCVALRRTKAESVGQTSC